MAALKVGAGTKRRMYQIEYDVVAFSDKIQHLDSLAHNFGTNTVTVEQCNFILSHENSSYSG